MGRKGCGVAGQVGETLGRDICEPRFVRETVYAYGHCPWCRPYGLWSLVFHILLLPYVLLIYYAELLTSFEEGVSIKGAVVDLLACFYYYMCARVCICACEHLCMFLVWIVNLLTSLDMIHGLHQHPKYTPVSEMI